MMLQNTDHEKKYKALEVISSAFKSGAMIPSRYTCEGMDINPPLDISGTPTEARSLALIVEDPDAPRGTWLHWLVWNIPITHHIRENEIPGIEGMNDFGKINYGGPCPPSGKHRYFFKVYALDTLLDVAAGTKRYELEDVMRDHVLAYGELAGVYQNSK